MGRKRNDVHDNHTFAPQISEASKRIAARRLQSLDGGVPHFMLNIKCREPLAPIPSNSDKQKIPTICDEANESDRESKDELISDTDLSSPKLSENCIKFPKDKKGGYALRTGTMATKANVLLDDSIFTFRPKVSSASVKIVESLGTDFMSRQQQHLERQKKHIEQAPIHFSSYSGRLSPVLAKPGKKTIKPREVII
ncbi:uncharacterized protein LOC132555326 [Ylistrum balloti]|uniref:uncharacterized protein LOC132555326 n=1 Tax=Ylistrum balloti TaxID=509963 RepID=UPI002905BD22|nr:uncharacterized protein LOC132555326 [Ylistrum balloti]